MEKGKNKGVIIGLIFFIILSICLGGYILYDKMSNKGSSEVQTFSAVSKSGTTSTNSQKVSKVTDKKIIDDLDFKISFINSEFGNMLKYNGRISEFGFRYSRAAEFGDIFGGVISDDTKLRIVLSSLGANRYFFPNYSPDDLASSALAQYSGFIDENTEKNVIFATTVEKAYKDIFGVTLKKHKSLGSSNIYVYDESKNLYYKLMLAGGDPGLYFYYYANNYLQSGNKITVDVYYGSADFSTGKIYRDKDRKQILKNYNGDIVDFTINAKNYRSFEKYTYTFNKGSNGYYYFVSLRKA